MARHGTTLRPTPCAPTHPGSDNVDPVAANVCIPVFEGPFDVLLQLVTDHKLDVYDIPIAEVVDRFVAEMSARRPLELHVATEFLVIAAILVEMKSRKLLPGPDAVDPDDELCGFEARDRLLARLLELQAYAAASDAFAVLMEHAARSVPRTAGLEAPFRELAPDLLADVSPADVAAAFARATTPRPVPVVDLLHVMVEPVTVSEALAELADRLPGMGQSTFRLLTAECTTRMQVIVRFLALLELCKQGRITIDQGQTFGDLQVRWLGDARDLAPVGTVVPTEEYDG